jgi:hypothetical protein
MLLLKLIIMVIVGVLDPEDPQLDRLVNFVPRAPVQMG